MTWPPLCCAAHTSSHLQQVLWSYGQRGNDDFFVYHGFALPDNSDEDVVLFNSVHQLVEYAVHMLPSLWILKEQEPAEVITKAGKVRK